MIIDRSGESLWRERSTERAAAAAAAAAARGTGRGVRSRGVPVDVDVVALSVCVGPRGDAARSVLRVLAGAIAQAVAASSPPASSSSPGEASVTRIQAGSYQLAIRQGTCARDCDPQVTTNSRAAMATPTTVPVMTVVARYSFSRVDRELCSVLVLRVTLASGCRLVTSRVLLLVTLGASLASATHCSLLWAHRRL